jgi:DNA-binding YbaB/EbfC family protein
MTNFNKMMQQAQQMQLKMASLQKELDVKEFEASTGGGAVKVRVNGKQEILSLELTEECVDPADIEVLQELVKSAVNQALKESRDTVSESMSKITGGMNIPGLF